MTENKLIERRAPSIIPGNWYDTKKFQEVVKNAYAPGATEEELMLFASVCKEKRLSPMNGEISFQRRKMKDGGYRVLFVVSRDGYLKIAKDNPDFLGLNSDIVYSKDTFSIETTDEGKVKISHKYGLTESRGEIRGAWAIARRKGVDPVFSYVDFKEYNEANKASNMVWGSYPSRMILKVAESISLKKQFNINGLNDSETVDSYSEQVQIPQVPIKKIVSQEKQDMEMLTEGIDEEYLQIEVPKVEVSVPKTNGNASEALRKAEVRFMVLKKAFPNDMIPFPEWREKYWEKNIKWLPPHMEEKMKKEFEDSKKNGLLNQSIEIYRDNWISEAEVQETYPA